MTRSPLLLGHRGARATRSIPENTLPSFQLALDHGCDGFEFDVRRSADGVPVICHDPKANRSAGVLAGCPEGVPPSARTRQLEIAKTSAKNLALPTLQEVLQQFGARAFLDIELKVPGLEAEVLAALRQHPPTHGYVLSSFLPEVLTTLRALVPNVPIGSLSDTKNALARWRDLPVQWVIPHLKLVDQKLIDEVHAAEKKIMVWTVNRATDMRQLADHGVDAIISDETESLVHTLRPNPR